MRLSDDEVACITKAIHRRFSEQARIYVFGSRIDDFAKGGDIDLLVDLDEVDTQSVRHSCEAIADIQMYLGEQKIDLLVRHSKSPDLPIYNEALQGVLL